MNLTHRQQKHHEQQELEDDEEQLHRENDSYTRNNRIKINDIVHSQVIDTLIVDDTPYIKNANNKPPSI